MSAARYPYFLFLEMAMLLTNIKEYVCSPITGLHSPFILTDILEVGLVSFPVFGPATESFSRWMMALFDPADGEV